jgi:hypothetical protein
LNTKHRKTLEAIFGLPLNSNLEWRRVEALLVALGAQVIEGEGSRVTGIPPQPPYSGELVLHVPPEVHAHAVMRAEAHGKNLNEWAAEVLANAS